MLAVLEELAVITSIPDDEEDDGVPLPTPCKSLEDRLRKEPLMLMPEVTLPVVSLVDTQTTKSVKVCGIEVNSIEAAAVPRVLVSISFIV